MQLLRRHLSVVLAAAIAAAGTGCAVLAQFGWSESAFVFPHAKHTIAQDLSCKDCHKKYNKGPEAGMPVINQCMLCHEEIDAEKPPERKINVLFDGKKAKVTGVANLIDDVKFSHQTHVKKGKVECTACHKGVEEAMDMATAAFRVEMDDCTTCHTTQGVKTSCETCHKEITAETAPPTHEHNWTKWHGQVARSESELTRDRCDLCHKTDWCSSCHQQEPPENHTQFWRSQGHGITAQIDRDTCATCHRPDTCTACHQETAPHTHTATWGNPRDMHCATCHEPLQNEGCAQCHNGTPSHLSAGPLPAFHRYGMNCRQCHGLDAPMPHIDNGENCLSCHR